MKKIVTLLLFYIKILLIIKINFVFFYELCFKMRKRVGGKIGSGEIIKHHMSPNKVRLGQCPLGIGKGGTKVSGRN